MTPRAVATELATQTTSHLHVRSSAKAHLTRPALGSSRSRTRPHASVIIMKPAPDLYVPFEATEDGKDVSGFVWVTFGTDQCVEFYGEGRADKELDLDRS
jgi:hypothetical protein